MRAALLFPLVLLACSGPEHAVVPATATGHPGEAWWAYRVSLEPGATVASVKAADAALSEDTPPDFGALSPAMAREAAGLWQSLCASCHGPNGGLKGVDLSVFEKAPRKWDGIGPSFGFFFGGDKMRAGIYRSLRDGKGQMPPFGPMLSRAQRWALVRHLEAL